MKTIVLFTDSGYWGKGKTLNEAKKNATYKRSNRVSIFVVNCKPEDITVSEGVAYPPGSVCMQITNGYEKL